MEEQIRAVIDGLTAILDNMQKLSSVENDVADAEARLHDAAKQHAETVSQLEDKSKLLTTAQAEERQNHVTQMYHATQELRDLRRQVEEAKAQHAELSSAVRSRRQEHNEILASMESLRKKFA